MGAHVPHGNHGYERPGPDEFNPIDSMIVLPPPVMNPQYLKGKPSPEEWYSHGHPYNEEQHRDDGHRHY